MTYSFTTELTDEDLKLLGTLLRAKALELANEISNISGVRRVCVAVGTTPLVSNFNSEDLRNLNRIVKFIKSEQRTSLIGSRYVVQLAGSFTIAVRYEGEPEPIYNKIINLKKFKELSIEKLESSKEIARRLVKILGNDEVECIFEFGGLSIDEFLDGYLETVLKAYKLIVSVYGNKIAEWAFEPLLKRD